MDIPSYKIAANRTLQEANQAITTAQKDWLPFTGVDVPLYVGIYKFSRFTVMIKYHRMALYRKLAEKSNSNRAENSPRFVHAEIESL